MLEERFYLPRDKANEVIDNRVIVGRQTVTFMEFFVNPEWWETKGAWLRWSTTATAATLISLLVGVIAVMGEPVATAAYVPTLLLVLLIEFIWWNQINAFFAKALRVGFVPMRRLIRR